MLSLAFGIADEITRNGDGSLRALTGRFPLGLLAEAEGGLGVTSLDVGRRNARCSADRRHSCTSRGVSGLAPDDQGNGPLWEDDEGTANELREDGCALAGRTLSQLADLSAVSIPGSSK